MFKKLNLLFACLLMGVLLPVCAHSTQADAYLKLGISAHYFGYKEFDEQDVLLDREDGLLPGVLMEFGGNGQSISGALRFELFDGLVDYDGQTGSGVPLTTKTEERITTFEALLRFNVKPLEKFNAKLVTGLGHREWRRNIQATNITNSLFEVYRWKYFTLGGAATLWRRGKWSAGVDVRWLRPIQPTILVDIVGFDEVALDLKPRNSARINFPFKFVIGAGQQWTLTPYWESWHLGRSETKRLTIGGAPTTRVVTEPRSETNIVGVTVAVRL